MPLKGIKAQVFGGVLASLGALTALLSRAIGFELDIFYVIIGIAGAGLFVYGSMQRIRPESTAGHRQCEARSCGTGSRQASPPAALKPGTNGN